MYLAVISLDELKVVLQVEAGHILALGHGRDAADFHHVLVSVVAALVLNLE